MMKKYSTLKQTYPVLADKIIHKNFLDIDQPFDEPFTVIGNFPYNISTQILFKVLEWKDDVRGGGGHVSKRSGTAGRCKRRQ